MALKGTLLWQPQESSTLTLAKVGNDNVFGVHHVLQEKWESGSPVLYGYRCASLWCRACHTGILAAIC